VDEHLNAFMTWTDLVIAATVPVLATGLLFLTVVAGLHGAALAVAVVAGFAAVCEAVTWGARRWVRDHPFPN
jgi:hypothetical protein